MFARIRFLLAAFDRLEFCEAGLCARLDRYVERSAAVVLPPRKLTVNGLPMMPPISWSEP